MPLQHCGVDAMRKEFCKLFATCLSSVPFYMNVGRDHHNHELNCLAGSIQFPTQLLVIAIKLLRLDALPLNLLHFGASAQGRVPRPKQVLSAV